MRSKYLKYWYMKTVLITGGSSGIGFELALYINGIAKNIVIISDDDIKLKEAYSKLIAKEHHSVILNIKCDIGNFAEVNHMSESILSTIGCPDIIINNAGFAYYHTFDQMTDDEIEKTANVNFIGFLRVTRSFIPYMTKSNSRSCIVNIASIAGALPITPNAVYCASKAGMMVFSELLQIELYPYKIDVICICPGKVITPFFDHESYSNRKLAFETSIVTSINEVVRGVIKAVSLRKKVIFIPKYWFFISWLIRIDRIISWPLYKLYLSNRVTKLRNY